MKKFAVLLVSLMLLVGLTACGEKSNPADMDDPKPQEEVQKEASNTFTGIIEDKTDTMIVVGSEDGTESYIFDIGEGVICEAAVKDLVTVTYTGDLSKFDPSGNGEVLVATQIEMAE